MNRLAMKAGICLAGILIGFSIDRAVMKAVGWKDPQVGQDEIKVEEEVAVEEPMEKKTFGMVKSSLRNKKKCFLCGEKSKSLMGYYRKMDDLGILCVNDWEITDMEILSHDRDGNLTEGRGVSTRTSSSGNEGCSFWVMNLSARGVAEVKVDFGEDSIFDLENARKRLCQSCLDNVLAAMETYGPEDTEASPRDLCLVDFQTLEIYSLQSIGASYTVRDFYVYVWHDEEKMEVTGMYAPELGERKKYLE